MKTRSTMTEILSRISLYEKKLQKGFDLDGVPFISMKKKIESTVNGTAVSVVEDKIKSSYQSTTDLIENYIKLSAIKNEINSTVKIKIAGKEMSIASVLVYQRVNVENFYQLLIYKMKTNYNTVMNEFTSYNAVKFSDDNINKYLAVALGTDKDLSNIDQEVITRLMQTFHDQNDMEFIDPLDLKKEIDKLEEWKDDFYNNVSFRLSEINSRIIVEYDLDSDIPDWRIVNMDEIQNLDSYLEDEK